MPPPNQTQAEIARLLLELDTQRTAQMRQQVELMEALRQSQSGQAVDMAALETRLTSLGSTAGGVGSSAEAGADRASGAYGRLGNDATTLGDDLREVGAGLQNIGDRTAESWDNLGRVIHDIIPADLREQLEGIQQTFGGLTGEGGVYGTLNEQAARFRDVSFEIHDGLLATSGPFADAFGMIPRRALGSTADVLKEFNEYISGPQGMINGLALSRVATGDMALELRGLAKSMNLSASEMQTFMTRQISLTGEAGTDMAREAAVYSQRLARATGDSAKFISQNLVKIIDDTERFGNVTVDEAARISVTLRQLGVGYEELGGMVGAFTSFDNAAQSVSALTTVFGVQLDAMEMMTLANEDQEQFLFRMREQFLATGKSVDDMTLAEKRLVKEQLGLSSIEAVERLFDPSKTISSMEELSAVTDEGVGGTQEVMAELAENIVDLQSATEYSADAMMNIMRERMLIPSRELAIEMEENYTRMGASFERAVPEHVADAMTAFGEGITTMLSDVDMEQVRDNLEGIAVQTGNVQQAVQEWRESDIGTALEEATETNSGVPGLFEVAMTGIESAATDIADAFGGAVDAIIQKLHDAGLLPVSSPNKVGEQLAEGTGTAPAEIVKEAWEESFDEVGSAANRMISERQSAEDAATSASERRASQYANTIESQISSITDAERAAFEERDDISSTQLAEELGRRESIYAAVAREAGEQRLVYEDLTEAQKEEYAARLRLGRNHEAELRQILSSDAYQEGVSQSDTADRIQGLLSSYQDTGTAFSDFSDDFKRRLRDQYGITEEIYNAAMEEGSNIADIATSAADHQAESLRRQQAEEEGTAGEDDQETSRNNREANSATAQYTRTLVQKQTETNAKLDTIASTLAALSRAFEEKDMGTGDMSIVLDGKEIVDYIVRNPSGMNTQKTIVLK